MKSTKVSIGDNATAAEYNNLVDDAKGGSFLLVRQQATPNMTLKVEAGVCYVGNTRVIYAGGNTPSFSAPSTNPRIDIVTVNSSGTIAITQGIEAASPSVPAYPADKLVLAEVYNRVGESSVKDANDGTNGYVYNDVRPFLGGSYIASDSQVAAGSAIKPSKLDAGNVDVDWAPDADNTRKLGTSSRQWSEVRGKKLYSDNVLVVGAKFGGDGSDGALSISSGTTTIDLGASQVVVKNYTSISITGTGKLAFTNPHANGTLIILKSQGDVTLTSSTAPMIDASGMGGQGGVGGASGVNNGGSGYKGTNVLDESSEGGGGGGHYVDSSIPGPAGSAGAQMTVNNSLYYTLSVLALQEKRAKIFCGSGGGGGGGAISAKGGDGGAGGGALMIECAGAWNFTTANGISVAGKNGSAGDSGATSSGGGGGGGGGSAGSLLVLYNVLTANSGTVVLTGGTGGAGGNTTQGNSNYAYDAGGGGGAGDTGGAGGAGGLGGATASNGASGGAASGVGAGGGGGGGAGMSNSGNRTGGSGGSGGAATSNYLITKNTLF